jgi:hypothetical protein
MIALDLAIAVTGALVFVFDPATSGSVSVATSGGGIPSANARDLILANLMFAGQSVSVAFLLLALPSLVVSYRSSALVLARTVSYGALILVFASMYYATDASAWRLTTSAQALGLVYYAFAAVVSAYLVIAWALTLVTPHDVALTWGWQPFLCALLNALAFSDGIAWPQPLVGAALLTALGVAVWLSRKRRYLRLPLRPGEAVDSSAAGVAVGVSINQPSAASAVITSTASAAASAVRDPLAAPAPSASVISDFAGNGLESGVAPIAAPVYQS